jgi:hypothetical protein
MSPHEALLSASGLRPMSAFVVVGSVVIAVAGWVVRLANDDARQPARIRTDACDPPAYSIAARGGEPIARFVPRFDLELSPRSLWQAHTPRRIAESLSAALGGTPPADELLRAMLPDADEHGTIRVTDWTLSNLQAQRVSDWIADGAGTGRGPLSGITFERHGDGWQLAWQPEVLLGEDERRAHGVPQAWRWARRIADGLHACRSGLPLDPVLAGESEARRARDAIWKLLLPSAYAQPLRGIAPDLVLPLRAALEQEGVAAWQMRIAYARDRVYPAGEHELFGSWGWVGEAREPAPRAGLELACDRLLADRRYAFLERKPELYRWIDDRPVRGTRANNYLDFTPASTPPVVRTTLDLGLQAFLGQELRATLEEHRAALAMGIVIDVASGAILAVDSAEAYPLAPFAPIYHVFTTGSTFKAITAAVALEEGVVHPGTEFEVGQGEYRVPYPDGRPSGRVVREAEGALTGRDELRRFFAYSVNAALAQVGLRVEDRVFRGYLERLGYGRPAGSGLGPERSGNLPALPWSYAYTHASIGFGHEFSTTLWRHAEALATVLRGGEHRPLTLFEAVEQDDRRFGVPTAPVTRVFSEATCADVRDMMRLGALEGTGREVRRAFSASLARAFDPRDAEGAAHAFDLGTKTGTAQKVPTEQCVHVELSERARWEREGLPATRARIDALSSLEKPHSRCYTSSICAFGSLPGSANELMVLIVVDEPRSKVHYGSQVAGPAAERVLAEAFGLTQSGLPPAHEVAPGFGPALAATTAAAGGAR